VPAPGVELKLVPSGGKLEIRVRGPNVSPGYWKRPDLTQEIYDDEGFYRPGDAVRWVEPGNPGRGVVFDGRLAEDFKLASGTWVNVGPLRIGLLAAASPVLQDAVIAGENRAFVGVLAWLNAPGCQKLIGADTPPPLSELCRNALVREHVRAAVEAWNRANTGGSRKIGRLLLLPDAPSIDANEITDKGYINQRLALERRKDEQARLFAAHADGELIVLSGSH